MGRIKETLDRMGLSKESPLELYSDIQLTEDETQEALRVGREKKYYALKTAAYWEDVNRPRNPKTYSASDLIEAYRNQYTIDSDNEEILHRLASYFTGDGGYDKSKGILLFGPVGCGKTTLMRFFMHNQVQCFTVVPCRKVEQDYGNSDPSEKHNAGENVINRFSYPLQSSLNGNPFGHEYLGYCFDDLGTETIPAKFFGKEKNIMADILLNRYDNELPFNMTHVTTNLSADQIKQIYGSRVTDRMRQMFNFVTFYEDAKSRRL